MNDLTWQSCCSPDTLAKRDSSLPPWTKQGSSRPTPNSAGRSSRRWSLKEVEPVVAEMLDRMRPRCTRLVCAGSYRRKRPDFGDLEFVYISIVSHAPPPGEMFACETLDAEVCIEQMMSRGILVPRLIAGGHATSVGPLNKLLVHARTGIPIDLFRTTEQCWFNYLVCRTGGKQNNIDISVAASAKNLSWNPYGPGFTRLGSQDHIAVRSEEQVYETVGLPYKRPEERL